jgi:hypothetical protein
MFFKQHGTSATCWGKSLIGELHTPDTIVLLGSGTNSKHRRVYYMHTDISLIVGRSFKSLLLSHNFACCMSQPVKSLKMHKTRSQCRKKRMESSFDGKTMNGWREHMIHSQGMGGARRDAHCQETGGGEASFTAISSRSMVQQL